MTTPPFGAPGTPAPTSMSAGTLSPDGLWVWNGREWVSAAPVTTRTYGSALSRRTLAIGALFVALLAQLFFVAALIGRLDIVNRLSNGVAVSPDEATNSDNLVRVAAGVELATLALGAVFFLVWLHRVVSNNHALGARALRFGPGGAVGWWFCPVVNWWQPFVIMRETWRASDPAAPASTPDQRAGMATPLLLVGWYVTFLVSDLIAVVGNVIGRSVDSATDPAATLDSLHTQTIAYLIASAVSVVAAAFAIALVLRITDRQQELQSVMSTTSAAPQPAPATA